MGYKLAIDFGTTNSVIALWLGDNSNAELLRIPQISTEATEERPSFVPSLVYVVDGRAESISMGQAVRDRGLDRQHDNRLFRNFKRGIVAAPAPDPRIIDGTAWSDRDVGSRFMRALIDSLPYKPDEIEQLVLSAPVGSFEGYLAWLHDVIQLIPAEKIRIVDESTAAALGYAVTKPGALVMVFDFGGGTLDLSLVQLPESREKTGGFLGKLRKTSASQFSARVIAKAGHIIGGSDIDRWLLEEVLERAGLTLDQLSDGYSALITECEEAKIRLSTVESTTIHFEAAGAMHSQTITRGELEALLETRGFYAALRRIVDKVMYIGHQRGIFKEDIQYVLMVGGTSLMPSVQRTLGEYFTDMAVRADKPFTAVAEGALQMAAGYGLQDYLIHTYGIRHLNPQTGAHEYDELVPMGSTYPITEPIALVLCAAHTGQSELEFVIGEIDAESFSMIEVEYEADGSPVFLAHAADSGQRFAPLNGDDPLRIKLDPPGVPGEERLQAQFTIDDQRRLRLSILDLKTSQALLYDVPVATLR